MQSDTSALAAFAHCDAIRFSFLFDGRCLTAEPEVDDCNVRLMPCAEVGEPNATLQAWRLVRQNATGLHTIVSVAREHMESAARGTCKDSLPDCVYWASQGECESNPGYMRVACPKSCGATAGPCRPQRVCSTWSYRAATRADKESDPSAMLRQPLLALAPPSGRRRHLAIRLDLWSQTFGHHLVRVACPSAPGVTCCLEAGLWSLGPRNARVKHALVQPCSFHEAAMFPFQQWNVGCAALPPLKGTPGGAGEGAGGGANGGAGREEGRGGGVGEEHHRKWLETLVETEGGEALQRLLPYEALGVSEFASAEEAHIRPDRPCTDPAPHTT